MPNSILTLVLLAVLVLTVAGVCCLAITSHRRIAEQAMHRARPEDVPRMLETSGRTLGDLLNSLKLLGRWTLPMTPADMGSPINGGSVGDVEPSLEETE
ncbi:hypothetical protein [Streptomyces luteireticuli]|uniref:Uncharacterized protein n=1 Tax=Streptomyces luteireticuli TaxID=173858 RepID=A0ABP3ITY4_9ACTN